MLIFRSFNILAKDYMEVQKVHSHAVLFGLGFHLCRHLCFTNFDTKMIMLILDKAKYSPAEASTSTHAYIDPKISFATSFETAGLLVRFNNDPAGVLFAVDNDEAVASLQLVVRPGGWPLLLVNLHDHELLRPVVRGLVVILFLPLSQGHHSHQFKELQCRILGYSG